MNVRVAAGFGLLGIVLSASVWANPTATTESHSFVSCRAAGAIDRVESALEVGGDLKILEDSKVKPFKMSVLANLTYDERALEVPKGSRGTLRSIRHYEKAAATLQVGDEGSKPTLRDERRLIGAAVEGATVTLFSPHGPLTRDELDLIDLLGNSLLMDLLLPQQPVKVGDTWKYDNELMAALLGLDAVSESDVASALLTVDDARARFEMNGKVSGAIGGVSTEIELKAKYHFDRKANRVSWFGLLIKENRSIGHVGPGLDVVARLQMKIAPNQAAPRLADAALAGLSLKPTPELSLLQYESPGGGWQFLQERDWYVTSDEASLAVLRLVQRGEFLAQCKVSSLPTATPGKEVTLAAFQEDIKRGLGKSFKQFVEAGQTSNELDYRLYRVIVDGEASELPIRWIYYYVGDKFGRQVVFAFTVEGRLLDTFDEADQRLLGTLRLADPKVAAKQ